MKLDERGKQCPLPVIEAKRALETCSQGEYLEVTVDNEIAVQNLKKLADHKGLKSTSKKLGQREFVVSIQAGAGEDKHGDPSETEQEEPVVCQPDARQKGLVAVISSNQMGQGDEALGTLLMKGFLYSLTQQEKLPATVLLYNSGAFLSCQGSENLEDLRELEARGVEILTCGTCLNHYGLGDKLGVGGVTNMYEIAERMTGASLLVRP